MHHVEVVAERLFQELDPGLVAELLVRQAQGDHFVHAVRMQEGQSPNNRRTPVLADKGCVFVSVVVEKRDEVTRQVLDVVVRNLARTRRFAVAPLIRDDDVVARFSKRGHLVAPGKSMLWPAMAEHNGPSHILLTCFEHFELHAVDRNQRGLGKLVWI